jgi:hypothetical protein
MNKKAQSEIMGLVIIVVIITVAMLVYLSYSSNQHSSSKPSMYSQYSHNELAVSFIDTLLSTNIKGCGLTTIEELIIDCGTGKNQLLCQGKASCDLLKTIIIDIEEKTLKQWSIPYGINLRLTQEEEFFYNSSYAGCKIGTIGRGTPGVFVIPYLPHGFGSASIELAFCS